MTIANIHLFGSRGYVVTDTACYAANGEPRRFTFKAVPLPQFRSVAIPRGAEEIGLAVRERLETLTGVVDFDTLVEAAPALLREATLPFLHMVEFAGDELDPITRKNMEQPAELFVAGWSDMHNHLAVATMSYATDFKPEVGTWATLYAPGMPECQAFVGKKMKDPARGLVEVAKIQKEAIIRDYGYGAGGELILTEFSRNGFTSRVVYTFPDRDEVAAAMLDARLAARRAAA